LTKNGLFKPIDFIIVVLHVFLKNVQILILK
jgi:hypothetical protein